MSARTACSSASAKSAPRSATTSVRSDRKSTRLNSSHRCISYAVFCLKKKKNELETGATAGIGFAIPRILAAEWPHHNMNIQPHAREVTALAERRPKLETHKDAHISPE